MNCPICKKRLDIETWKYCNDKKCNLKRKRAYRIVSGHVKKFFAKEKRQAIKLRTKLGL